MTADEQERPEAPERTDDLAPHTEDRLFAEWKKAMSYKQERDAARAELADLRTRYEEAIAALDKAVNLGPDEVWGGAKHRAAVEDGRNLLHGAEVAMGERGDHGRLLVFLATVGASTPDDHPWVREARALANDYASRVTLLLNHGRNDV